MGYGTYSKEMHDIARKIKNLKSAQSRRREVYFENDVKIRALELLLEEKKRLRQI
jgi:hypothetical protein